MYPIILKIGPITLHSYGLMMAIAFLTALHFIQKDAKAAGYEPKIFADLAFIVLPLGIIGARLAHIIMFDELYSWSDPIGWIAVWNGGLVFQGGPPLAITFGFWYLNKHKVSVWKACDIIFPYVALGHGIGRIGCLLKGCCFGATTNSPLGMQFPRIIEGEKITGSPAYLDHLARFQEITHDSTHSLPVHPTQLFSFAGLVVIFAILWLMRKHWKPFEGFIFPVYLMLYGIFRFWVEGLRGDNNPIAIFNLTDQQLFGLLGSLIGLVFFFALRWYQLKNTDQPEQP